MASGLAVLPRGEAAGAPQLLGGPSELAPFPELAEGSSREEGPPGG